MKRYQKTLLCISTLAFLMVALFIGGYNGLVSKQESVTQSWAQVQAQYQRRLDLIPNLVATVKGVAKHESDTLIQVIKARQLASNTLHRSTATKASALAQFDASQQALTQALGRLMVVVERYPTLKANENFLALQTQLEGTENRITVARERFNTQTQRYDIAIRRFPSNLVAKIMGGFPAKPYFQAPTAAATAPTITF